MVEIIKPDFLAGNEQKFKEFINNIQKSDKIALISHKSDPDGVISAKIATLIINPEMIKFVGYDDLNESLVDELKNNNINKVVFTDLYIKKQIFVTALEEIAEVLIVDHHLFEKDWNSKKTTFLNAQGFCASYLTYYLVSQIKDIQKYDWLVAAASVSDWCYTKNQEWMKEIYAKYGEKFEGSIEGIKKSKFFEIADNITYALIYTNKDAGKVYAEVGEKFGDIGGMERFAEVIKKEIKKELENFDKNKTNIRNGYFFETKSSYPISSYISTSVSSRVFDKTIIIGEKLDDKTYKLSLRRQDKKENMDQLSKKLTAGLANSDAGGHVAAAGATILLSDLKEFKKRLQNI